MKFPITRIDLKFWDNIRHLGQKPWMISKNTKLEQFNKIYNDYSLFHYFSGNADVIQTVHDKYKEAEDNDELTSKDELIPLMILNPDINGQTALDLALQ